LLLALIGVGKIISVDTVDDFDTLDVDGNVVRTAADAVVATVVVVVAAADDDGAAVTAGDGDDNDCDAARRMVLVMWLLSDVGVDTDTTEVTGAADTAVGSLAAFLDKALIGIIVLAPLEGMVLSCDTNTLFWMERVKSCCCCCFCCCCVCCDDTLALSLLTQTDELSA
jgi:hypothetical protein